MGKSWKQKSSNRGRKENINGEKLETEKREKKKLSYSYLNQLAMIERERQIKAGCTPFFPPPKCEYFIE